MALVGGCETKVTPMGLMRWSLLGRLNTTSNENPAAGCRPYDEAASGAVLAEGGAVLVIEEYEHAIAARGDDLCGSRGAGGVGECDAIGDRAGCERRGAGDGDEEGAA